MKLDMQWKTGFILLNNGTEFLQKKKRGEKTPYIFFSEKLVVFKSIAEENKPLIFSIGKP